MDGTNTSYHVLRLIAENVKRLKAVDVTPNRNVQIVTGKNANGKSSLIDSIAYVLGGKRDIPSVPLRRGAADGQIVCVIGDDKGGNQLLVKRTFTADGKTTLEITQPGGFRAPSPQAILDALVSRVAFDPTGFVRLDPAKQAETLRKLVGLDFSEIDKSRKLLYDERTATNKTVKSLSAQVAGITVPADTPANEVSVMDLMAEQRKRQEHNRKNEAERTRLASAERDVTILANAIVEIEAQLEAMKKKLDSANDRHAGACAIRDAAKGTVAVLEEADVDAVQRQIIAAQGINANVAKRVNKTLLELRAAEAQQQADDLTGEIEALDTLKQHQLAEAKWPVEGLAFGEEGVLYNGLPFDQASSAEQMRVSVAIGAALSPQLPVILCRDASLLDDEQMRVITDFAEQRGVQVWLEVVDSEGGPGKILIEDGSVVSGGTPPEVAPITKTARKRKTKAPVEPEQARPPDTIAEYETHEAEYEDEPNF